MENMRELGRSIKQAVDFLQEVYQQVQGLFLETEKLLNPVGYSTIMMNEVILVNSRNLSMADEWLRPSVARILGRKEGENAGREFIALVVHLSPKAVLDEAVVILERLVFPEKMGASYVQSQFNKSDWLESFVKGPVEAGKTIHLEPKTLRGVFDKAEFVQVAVWPLTAMKNQGAVDGSLVQKVREWAANRAMPEQASAASL